MPKTLTPTPARETVTVPGTAELEFTAGSTGSQKLDVVVLYTVMDNAAIRIASGASQMRTIGPRNTVVRQRLGFERTNEPTPGAFRVKAVVIEDGKPWAECTWNLQVTSSATQQVMKAMANVAPDAPYVPLPDDDEISALAERADRNASRKRAAKKRAAKKGAAKTAGAKKTAGKKVAATKGAAKKSAGKKAAGRKTAAKKGATRKAAVKKAGARKSTAKKAGAKRAGAKKAATTKRPAAKKAATAKRPAAKKKSAAKKRR